MQATAQCAATFVRAVVRPNNDPLDRELHRCIAEERDVARFTAALGQRLAGRPMQPLAVTRRLRNLLRRAEITGVQPCHGWRHTAATALLDGGQNIKTVQARLGHSTPAITLQLYVHPVAERDVEAADHFGKLIKRQQ